MASEQAAHSPVTRPTSGRYFLDTNVLVYTFDERSPAKRERALYLVEQALNTGLGVISYQVVQEFLNVATRRFAPQMGAQEAERYLKVVLVPLWEQLPSPRLYQGALDIASRTGYAFYDALILAAARESGCSLVYSEDLQHGRRLDGLTIVNPFVGTVPGAAA